MWKAFIKENVFKPALRRIGTYGAAVLMWGGDFMCTTFDACGLVTETGANTVVRYVTAVALLAYDLFASYLERKKLVK